MMRVPEEAKKVFAGKIFDVYHWEQEMFDGSHETFEMLKRPNTIEIIAAQGDKILLSKQSQPNHHNYYSLFGGRGEPDEAPETTAKRELLEESGLQSNDWELLKVFEPYHKIDWQIFLYVARNCKKVAEQQLDAGEKIETIEMSFEEFVELVISEKYWGNELAFDILKMKLDKKKLEDFRRKLFS
ncbi:MAG: NUDIX domain-containing protein [Patescibacteria group bacterium]